MSTQEPRDGFTQAQGIRLHYWEWGRTGAPDLLLVHGWTSFSKTWAAVAAHFHEGYHIVAPDLRGHGESDKPATGYRLRDFVEDIRQLIENLGLDRPAYVGHSWGGNIGTMMAAQHPEAISRAFLEDPVYWKMINAFVTNLPKAIARLDWPEADIRADAIKQGLSDEQASHEVYRHHHFLAGGGDETVDRQPGLGFRLRGPPAPHRCPRRWCWPGTWRRGRTCCLRN